MPTNPPPGQRGTGDAADDGARLDRRSGAPARRQQRTGPPTGERQTRGSRRPLLFLAGFCCHVARAAMGVPSAVTVPAPAASHRVAAATGTATGVAATDPLGADTDTDNISHEACSALRG